MALIKMMRFQEEKNNQWRERLIPTKKKKNSEEAFL